MLYILCFLIGFIFASCVVALRLGVKDGVLKIDHSDPEKDVYRFELGNALEDLHKRKYIVLKIDNNADLSQE